MIHWPFLIPWVALFVLLLAQLFRYSHRVGYLEGKLRVSEERYERVYQLYNSEHSLWHRHGLDALLRINAYDGGNVVELEKIASDALYALGVGR